MTKILINGLYTFALFHLRISAAIAVVHLYVYNFPSLENFLSPMITASGQISFDVVVIFFLRSLLIILFLSCLNHPASDRFISPTLFFQIRFYQFSRRFFFYSAVDFWINRLPLLVSQILERVIFMPRRCLFWGLGQLEIRAELQLRLVLRLREFIPLRAFIAAFLWRPFFFCVSTCTFQTGEEVKLLCAPSRFLRLAPIMNKLNYILIQWNVPDMHLIDIFESLIRLIKLRVLFKLRVLVDP